MRAAGAILMTCLITFATPLAARGQSTAVDSQVVRIASATLMTELAPALAAVVKDAPPAVWIFAFPEENPAGWAPVRTQLLRSLNARLAAGADSALRLATISGLEVSTDSLVFKISIGSQWLCEGHWRGRGTVTTYVARRVPGGWSPAAKREQHVFDSDPC